MDSKRLPKSFHNTFKPERQYINALLKYVASGSTGSIQEISKMTGIPMGESSGKVPATIDYSIGMGLTRSTHRYSKKGEIGLDLTDFGRVVLLEDPFLRNDITQWIAHFNLCNPQKGADIWYYTFTKSAAILGHKFKREELDNYLKLQYKSSSKNLIGPLLGMYKDDSSFGLASTLTEESGYIVRKIAPIDDDYFRGYGAWLIENIADLFGDSKQIAESELEALAGWKSIPGWTNASARIVLEQIETKGIVSVDRHMEPWLIHTLKTPNQAWTEMYYDLI